MVMRQIVFDAQQGALQFRLLYSAFAGRPAEKITKDERRYFAEIQRALDAVSVPIGDLPEGADMDVRPRKLERTGVMELSQRAFDRLVTTVEETAFHPLVSAHIEELLEHLAGSARVESEARQLKAVGDR